MTRQRETTRQSETRSATPDTPVVCTVEDGDGPDQLLEWADLQARAIEVVAVDSGARMTLPASMFGQVQDLMKREASCCAFLNFHLAVQDEKMTFEVTAPNPDGLPVISALAGIPLQ